ncbi:Alpha-hydroxy acid dehydrogenase, FMN-dependent [Metarhizium album ARSEF 1941]|uniref:Alpha-hydroxy acid dehydrogenase, FMN-dependent n=1 Tax=Metarhizium album (strain ARSEF 1941) TaxID=1081103 RepID=A0A0B2WST4_METAS|nr:Alpha-hydroxy acid dehydrogenase, FMN-dependent [Metarhizium album ARSEF 1941]KHN96015.1 Alpha-hydroxy acid dehydrogenase, FMN-dependent [Metarhizium album ARSEF 1941]
MRSSAGILSALASSVLAARPFLNEPDTGLQTILGNWPNEPVPDFTEMVDQPNLPIDQLPHINVTVGLPDLEEIARKFLSPKNFAYYRNGAAGEYSYRNNLEVYNRYRLRPRVMRDISKIEDSLPTSLLGHNFSAPFYISACARADYAHPDAELNFVKAAAAGDILYMPAQFSGKKMSEIAAAKKEGQVLFQQVYLDSNDTLTKELFKAIEEAGSKAIVFTVDSAADGNRHRAARYGVTSAEWTKLPIIIKGIMTYEDAKLAYEHHAPAIILSNHGGRQLDRSSSSLEAALEIFNEDKDLFNKEMEIWADGGVRYGVDAIMLLSLGVKAVGIGRPFMYANMYGEAGPKRVIDLMKREIAIDAGNLGIANLREITSEYVSRAPTSPLTASLSSS